MSFTASVISAREWGARPPKDSFPETQPKFIIIHHTDTPNPPNDVSRGTLEGARRFAQIIQRTHMDQFGWSDSGHNFLNTTGGWLLEGRQGTLAAIQKGRCIRSAHAGNIQGNESPGIENEGNFMTTQMSAKQWNSLVELCAALCEACNLKPEDIRGHRDFSPTDCPGNWLYSQLPRLRQEVAQKLGLAEVLREGSSSPRVRELQQRLRDRGFNPGPIDGVFGSGTRNAVIAFQRSAGLTPDGIAGPLTLAALERQAPQPRISLVNAAKGYRGLPNQDQALDWLERQIPQATMEEFSRRWRNQG
jgi:hypothetical protein